MKYRYPFIFYINLKGRWSLWFGWFDNSDYGLYFCTSYQILCLCHSRENSKHFQIFFRCKMVSRQGKRRIIEEEWIQKTSCNLTLLLRKINIDEGDVFCRRIIQTINAPSFTLQAPLHFDYKFWVFSQRGDNLIKYGLETRWALFENKLHTALARIQESVSFALKGGNRSKASAAILELCSAKSNVLQNYLTSHEDNTKIGWPATWKLTNSYPKVGTLSHRPLEVSQKLWRFSMQAKKGGISNLETLQFSTPFDDFLSRRHFLNSCVSASRLQGLLNIF